MEELSYYIVIPHYILCDEDLKPNAKLLYGLIVGLTRTSGYCYATNEYISDKLGLSKKSITSLIKSLKEKEYIDVEVVRNDKKEVVGRKIYLSVKQSIPISQIEDRYTLNNGVYNNDKILKENNIYTKANEKNEKNLYGEFKNVKLSDEEYQKIKEKDMLKYIDILSEYKESKGKRYKNDYATILSWARKEQKNNNSSNGNLPVY